jgi:hypothetical protein
MADRARLVDDIMRVASGAFGTAVGLRDEVEAQMRQRMERLISRTDLVTRDEFEAVKAVAEMALAENVALADRVAALEAELSKGSSGRLTAKRSTGKAASAAKGPTKKTAGKKPTPGKASGKATGRPKGASAGKSAPAKKGGSAASG